MSEHSNRAVLVLGMHRSGTSALAGVLSRAGVDFGPHLIEAAPGVNARGFWEHRDIVAIHDELLGAFGLGWDDLGPLPPKWWVAESVRPHRDALLEILERDFSSVPLWGLKDPRLCRLLPLWLNILSEFGSQPVFTLIHRHPMEVSASLHCREGTPHRHGQMLWLAHVLDAEMHTRGLPRVIVDYGDLLGDWRGELLRIGRTLDLAWPVSLDTAAETVQGFLHTGLRHHHAVPGGPAETQIAEPWVDQLIPALQELKASDGERQRERITRIGAAFQARLNSCAPFLLMDAQRLRVLQARWQEANQTIACQADFLRRYERDAEHFNKRIPELDRGLRQAFELLDQRQKELEEAQRRLARLQPLEAALGERVADEAGTEQPSARERDEALQDVQKIYHGAIDLRVENNSHSKLVRLLREHSLRSGGRVLEVGCSSGFFGAYLRAQGYEVWGVEQAGAAAARAREVLDHVYNGTIEGFLADQALASIGFDCILFTDVLEHLADPTAVLQKCRRLLTAGGIVGVSIPNVTHKAVRLMLLEGHWDYADKGIMDDTHLRFFGRDRVVETMSNAGYAVLALDEVRLGIEDVGIDVRADLLEAVAPLIRDSDQDVYQFVLVARANHGQEQGEQFHNDRFRSDARPRVLALMPLEDWTVGDIRIRDPLARFRRRYGGSVRVDCIYRLHPADLAWADTIIVQRESNAQILWLISEFQRLGKRLIFEIDDLLTEVPPFLSVHEHCRLNRPYWQEALRMADAICVSTARLGEELGTYNERIYHIPNCAYSNYLPARHYESIGNPVTLVVASSDTVRVDFIVTALRRLVERSGLTVRLIGVGPPGVFLADAGLDVQQYPNMPHEQFKAFLASLDNGIGVIPLDDSRFSRCKSPVKYLDYSLAGLPCVCSHVPPYSELLTHGENGLLFDNDEESCYQAVLELARSWRRRQDIASEARALCRRDYSMARAADAWRQVFELVETGAGQQGSALVHNAPGVTAHGLETESDPPQVEHETWWRVLAHPRSYLRAWQIARSEGVSGLRSRLERWR